MYFIFLQMEMEIHLLETEIENRKPECGRLVEEVKTLITLITEQSLV